MCTCSHLGQVGDHHDLMGLTQGSQQATNHMAGVATNTGIDFIEEQGGRLRGLGGHDSEGQTHP